MPLLIRKYKLASGMAQEERIDDEDRIDRYLRMFEKDDLKKLHGKIIQAAKRKDETLRRQFQNARAQAFPGGEPQERVVGFVYFLNKYGPALVDRLYTELPTDAGTHWVVTI